MKTKLRGWKKIFAFAYGQSMKSKAMKITIIIMCAIALASMPVTSLITGSSGENGQKKSDTSIEKVYYYDNTGIIVKHFANKQIKSDIYNNVTYEQVDENDKGYIDKLINRNDNKNEVFLSIEYCDDENSLNYGISIYTYYSENSDVDRDDANEFAVFAEDNIQKAVLLNAGVEEEKINAAVKSMDYQVLTLNSEGDPSDSDDGISQFQYFFTLTCICILIFVVSLVGSKVSELIVTEKSTRVMEYILTSVKPMAVLVGKVIASTLIMLTIFAAVAASFAGSVVLNNVLFPSEDGSFVMPEIIKQLADNGALTGVTPVNIILIIIIIILGAMFYGCIAGIAGATVSKIEEMAEGMKIFTFAMLIGAYLPIFMAMTSETGGSWGGFEYVVFLLPLSSMFIVPEYLVLGKVSQAVTLGAIGLQVVFIVLVMLLVNRVYEHMLYSNGATLKLKDIIGMAKKGGVNNGN